MMKKRAAAKSRKPKKVDLLIRSLAIKGMLAAENKMCSGSKKPSKACTEARKTYRVACFKDSPCLKAWMKTCAKSTKCASQFANGQIKDAGVIISAKKAVGVQ